MTAQHGLGVHVAGVARLPGNRGGGAPEPVVVVGDGHDPRAAAPADLAVPGPRSGPEDSKHAAVQENLRTSAGPDCGSRRLRYKSATRNARSRDWLRLRRGSHVVS